MKRLVYAEDVNSVNLVDASIGEFSVPSETKSHNYNVFFKAPHDNEIPTCECLDWQRYYLPCKHILAIIQNKRYGSWNWEKLPPEYRESPFLTLDAEILFQPIEHILHDTDESKQSCSTQSSIANLEKQKEEVFTPSAQIPKPAFPKRTAVTRCCDLLSRIKTLVHECTNSTSLANLEKTLLSALTELEDSSNTDAGLTLVAPDTGEKSRKRKSSKSNDKANKKLKLGKLPSVQAKKNHPYNKRVGQNAAMMKRFFQTDLSLKDMENTPPFCRDNDTQTTNLSSSCANFTPIIREGSSLTATLLKNGPHTVSLLALKSLEPILPKGTQVLLSSVSKTTFKPRWLYDEVINSFFWYLQGQHANVLYVDSTVMLSLQNGCKAESLWREKGTEKMEFIIAPWNPSNYHWTFVAIDLQQKKMLYVDPLNSCTEVDNSAHMQILSKFLPSLLEQKFGMSGFQLTSPPHTLQPDFSSCGVLVCWYASQFVQGKPLNDQCDTYAMRVAIYNKIRGTCLRRRSGARHLELSKCPLCRVPVLEDEGNLKCKRCCQSYHFSCVSVEERPSTRENEDFYCPA